MIWKVKLSWRLGTETGEKNPYWVELFITDGFDKLEISFASTIDIPPDHLLLDSAPNLGPLISCCEVNKFKNCWYTSVRILEVLKLLFQQFLNLSSSQRDMSGPKLVDLSNNRWSWGIPLVQVQVIYKRIFEYNLFNYIVDQRINHLANFYDFYSDFMLKEMFLSLICWQNQSWRDQSKAVYI